MYYTQQISFSKERALIRVDFNVPLDSNFNITDDTRIRSAIPTIQKIRNDGGSVVLMSHLGRPKGGYEERYSLKHVVNRVSEYLRTPVRFISNCISEKGIEESQKMKAGEVVILENLRFHSEEKKGDRAFAAKLAQHGTIYVNDAFGSAHRGHASIATITQFFNMCVCGLLMEKEIKNASRILESAQRPFVAIMGGAKVSDKIMLMDRLLDVVDSLIIGGGMAYTFIKAQGGSIGKSIVESDKMQTSLTLWEKAKRLNKNILLPCDVVVASEFVDTPQKQTVAYNAIPDDMMGMDIGQETTKQFSQEISKAKTILWNGPMGVFEFSNFASGTTAIASSVAQATQKGAFSLIGGGDSAAAIRHLGFEKQVSYISTGGGALLEYMEGKILPGVTALEQN